MALGGLPSIAALADPGSSGSQSLLFKEAHQTAASHTPRTVGYADYVVVWQWSPPGNPELWSASWNPNGSYLAVGSNRAQNRSVFVLDSSNGSLVRSLDATDAVYATYFSPNGAYLVASGNNFGTRVYETGNWTPVTQLENGGDATDISWSPDGRYLSTVGPQAGGFNGRVTTFDATANFSPVSALSKQFGGRPVFAVDWSSDSTRLAIGLENVNGQDAFIYDRATGQEVRQFNCFSNCREVRYGPDVRYLALGRSGQRFGDNDVDALIWDTNQNYTGGGNPPVLSDYRAHNNGMAVNSLAYSPSGDAVATGGDDPNVDIWWSSNGTLAKRLTSGETREARFSSDGSRIAAAEFNPNRVTVWGDNKAPAVASVEISAPDRGGLPYYPDFLKAERAWFKVTFTENLDPAYPPNVTFGNIQPYKAHKVNSSGLTSPRVWEGWFNSSSTIENGEHHLQIAGARDTTGNVMAPDTNRTFWLDTRAPAFAIAPPVTYWQPSSSLNLSVNATDADPANSSSLAFVRPSTRWNNDLNVSWGNWTTGSPVNLSGTSFQGVLPFAFSSGEGHYEFAFSVYDRAMNSPSAFINRTAGHDLAGPAVTLTVVGSYWRNGSGVPYSFSTSDGVQLMRGLLLDAFSADNSSFIFAVQSMYFFSNKSASVTDVLPATKDGHYRIYASVSDRAGKVTNTSAAGAGLDNTPPFSALIALPSITNQQVLIINYTATDTLSGIARVQLEHRKDGGSWGACCPVGSPSGKFAFDTSLFGGDGLYEFRARAWDNATNEEPIKAANETWTLVDTTPPKLLLVFPSSAQTGVPATVHPRIEVNEAVTGTVRLMLDTTPVDSTISWTNGTIATIVPTSALKGGVLYRIEVAVQDLAGNKLTATSTFTTSEKPDTTPPKVSSTVPGPFSLVNTLDSVKIVFNEAMDAGTADSATISPPAVDSPALSSDGKTLTFKVVPATLETTYTVTIAAAKAKDLAGNTLDGNGDGIAGDDHVFEFFYSAGAPANLEVTVKDEAARPIVGANVSLVRSGRTIGPVATDAGGQSFITSLVPGDYSLTVAKSGYESQTSLLTLASGPNTVQVILVKGGAQRALDPIWILLLLAVIVVSAVFILLQRSRKCPRCSAQRDFGRKECTKCGYPKEMPKLFDGVTIAEAKPREPAPVAEPALPPPPPEDPVAPKGPAKSAVPMQAPKKIAAPPSPPVVKSAKEKRDSAAAKAAAKSPPAKDGKKAFDPYKSQLFTASKSGISSSDDVLPQESAEEEERRKKAIDEARRRAQEKEE